MNAIKRHQRFTVVIGNPPYSNFGQLNRNPFILGLLEDYKRGLNERKLNLDDDFIKFVRLGQYLLEASNHGIFGMITNNVFIDGITHRRMRESLLSSLGPLRVLDLHGSAKKLESAPDGSSDENVFDIQQGVGISLFCKGDRSTARNVLHADLRGTREAKYENLSRSHAVSQRWVAVDCVPPHFFLVPKSFAGIDEYKEFASIAGDIFVERNTGIQTKRDGLVYSFTRAELDETLEDMRSLPEKALVSKYELPEDGRDWSVKWAKADVRRNDGSVVRVAYHPFDFRWTYFTGHTRGLMAYPRAPLMRSALQPNRLLLTVRNPRRGNIDSFFATNTAVDKDSVSPFDNVTFFPLYVYSDQRTAQATLGLDSRRRPNLSASFIRRLCANVKQREGDRYGLPQGVTPEDIFNYAYSVFHSVAYRGRYAEFLKIDFPRLPLPGSLEIFRDLSRLGGELVVLHLLESPKLNDFVTAYAGPTNPEVGRVGWSDDTVWLDAAATKKGQPAMPGTVGFRGVPEAVWNFHIGGYQVCEKWLKDRKGRTLSEDDIAHYQKIVVALNETIRLMKEIDEVIEQHGGWPGAFQRGNAKAVTAEVTPFRPRIVEPKPEERYVTCIPLVPLKAAAGAFSDPQHIEDDGWEWTAVDTKHRLRPGMFVAQVVGKSMEPVIPDGAYCLFAAPVAGTRQGKTVLIQLRDATDPETGERYTVKRYASEKTKDADSWRHAMITLKPVNPDFQHIVLSGAEQGQLQVVAELIEVLPGKT